MSAGMFYVVTAKTMPWTQDMEKIVGYYSSENLANRVARMVSDQNIQRLRGGIDVSCNAYCGNPIDPKAVIKTVLDQAEIDRVTALRFSELLKRSSPSVQPMALDIKKTRVPDRFITDTFNVRVAGQNFTEGTRLAEQYAQQTYGDDLGQISISFRGGGICAMSLEDIREVDPIELQTITILAVKDQDRPFFKEIGMVLPEKDHLFTLKTAEEISEEIRDLIDQALKESSSSSGQSPVN
jgi:hypothetical protein